MSSSTVRVRPSVWHRGRPDEQHGVRIVIKLAGSPKRTEVFVPTAHLIPLADALVDTVENKEN